MSVQKVAIAAQAQSTAIAIELEKFPPGVGLICNVSAGASLTYSVLVSGDGASWNNHDTLVNLTASANGNILYPVPYVALNVTTYASGSVSLTVVQA